MSAGQISFAKQAEAFLKRVRKWDTEFCCIGTKKEAFSVPQPDEVVPRITANLEYFRVNYAICLALFAVVAIIVNPLMLVLVSVFGAAWYGLLTRPSNIKIQMGATLLGNLNLAHCAVLFPAMVSRSLGLLLALCLAAPILYWRCLYGTSLHRACWNGDVAGATALLDAGALVDATTLNGDTSLHWAALAGHAPIAKLLIARRASVSPADLFGVMPLHWAAGDGNVEIAQLLLEAGADVNSSNLMGVTSMHRAARNGHAAMVQLLLDNGADPEPSDWTWETPYQVARNFGHPNVTDLLPAPVVRYNWAWLEMNETERAQWEAYYNKSMADTGVPPNSSSTRSELRL